MKRLFSIVIFLVSWSAVLQPAWATTLDSTSLLELMDGSTHIVIAEVEDVTRRIRHKFARRAELVVTETIRGDLRAGDVIPLPFTSLIPFGFSGWPLRIEYRPGETYILFLEEDPVEGLGLYAWDGRILVADRDGPRVRSLRELLIIRGLTDERARVSYVLNVLLETGDFAYPYYAGSLIANIQDPAVLADPDTREALRYLLASGHFTRYLLRFLHSVWREGMFIELADLFAESNPRLAYWVASGIAREMRSANCVGRDDCEATIAAFLAGLEGVQDPGVYSKLAELLQLLIRDGDFSVEDAEKKFLPILAKRLRQSTDRSIRLTSQRALKSFPSGAGEEFPPSPIAEPGAE